MVEQPPAGAPQLVVVGSIALDDIETPWERHSSVLGGSATYGAIAAALFCRVGLVGVVGEDFPSSAITLLRNKGVDLSGLEVRSGKTFRWQGRYSENMDERCTLCTELNVFADFEPQIPQNYRSVEFLFLANIAPSLQLRVLDQIAGAEFVAADTMDLWINTALADLKQVLKRLDLVTLNESEIRQLTGERSLRRAAAAVRAMGPPMVLVKKGESGSVLFSRDQVAFIPAYPLEEVRDPTGAGDSFAGALMGWMAAERKSGFTAMWHGALVGSSAASFAVERFGADALAEVTPEMVLGRRDQLLAMTCPDYVKA